MISDMVRAVDSGAARLRNRAGEILQEAAWRLLREDDLDKPVVQVKGWVKALVRERGKLVRAVEGHNVWTNTGREYLSNLISLQSTSGTPFRDDRVAFIGVGTGFQAEAPSLVSLQTPIAYAPGLFLAPLAAPPTFPLAPSRTAVRFSRVFLENEITVPGLGARKEITEMGLFTNGSPTGVPANAPGSRDLTIASASSQSPVAYKSFEDALVKTDATQFEIYWEIRF